MRVLIQRAIEASIVVDSIKVSEIGKGLLVLVGVEANDNKEDVDYVAHKLINLRIFNDDFGKMNLSVIDVKGDILIVSQFTLHALTKKGNRPSFTLAAKPEYALSLFDSLKVKLENLLEKKVQTGVFGADMKVHLINDGPVTIWIDSKNP
jgi:D-tyrosyl-tRNA(Tyr) deacylase